MNDVCDKEIGNADRAEVHDKVLAVLKGATIEQDPDSRLARTSGLPGSWTGERELSEVAARRS